MSLDRSFPRRSAGFGLVAALFLMVIVTLIILTMARLSTAQHGTISLAIQQTRAYQAANAGLEWGIARALETGVCDPNASPPLNGSGLDGFLLRVECDWDDYPEADGGSITLYRLVATAQNGQPGAKPDYAYRQLSAVVERKP
ncbi:pilus assembly PilX family protein [Stutzerimonas xanthomarina]|uniref:pilus assembly PilX family protein n=1 Tax=Stutzerimonas xanthomarina TaxID=271420 RepID=UPI003AA9DEC8